MSSYGGLDCTKVGPQCPVEFTVLSYRPNLGANAFFQAIFALCAILQLAFGIKWKTWTFCFALTSGCIVEAIGYGGRIMLWENPFNIQGFTIQIVCLIIAPAFIAAGIYLTLKHFVIAFGREYSVIRPQLYIWIFICADIVSLVLQGFGGEISATGSISTAKTGTDIALAGICFQVMALVIFGALGGLYFFRVWSNRLGLSNEAEKLVHSYRFRMFAVGIVLAYLPVLIRCCYRIPELSGGWRNEVFRNELDFIVLDGVMMAIATLTLTVLHPGVFFPQLSAPFRDLAKGERCAQRFVSPGSSDSGLEERKVPQDGE